MNLSINEINNELEEKIFVNDETINKKIGRIKTGDMIIVDKNNDDNKIKKLIKIFETNYMNHNKRTLIYNANEKNKIENYVYAATMDRDIPNDIYSDVIEKNYEEWIIYKNLMKLKPLYLFNSKSGGIHNELCNIKNQIKDIELLIIIDDEVTSERLDTYHYYSYNYAVILLTDIDNIKNKNKYNNIKYLEEEYERV